jgi:surface polysaccharide O-acyltransferase-like enzyme
MNSRNFALDILKIISAIFIVCIHCDFFIEYDKTVSSLTTQGIFRIAVPIFFLTNGYYFRHAIERNKIKKWIIRVLILYAVWMFIYSPLWFDLKIKSNVITVFVGFFNLWYLKALLICGIIMSVIKKINSKQLLVLALILFFIGGIIQYLGNHHVFKVNTLDQLINTIALYRNFLFLGLPFFVIGYLINKHNWHKNTTKKQTIVFIIIGSLLVLIESYINFFFTKETIDILFSLILICPMIFIFTLELDYKINSKFIALFSTSIYLIHPWILTILKMIFIFDSTFLALLTIIFSFIISSIIIKLNTKLKFLL